MTDEEYARDLDYEDDEPNFSDESYSTRFDFCLVCKVKLPADYIYCEECYRTLIAEGFFEI